MSSSSRQQRLSRFKEAILAGAREQTHDILFRLLYGLPADLQIGIARDMTARFLPIFCANHPEFTWPGTVLDGYFREHEQALPDEPEEGPRVPALSGRQSPAQDRSPAARRPGVRPWEYTSSLPRPETRWVHTSRVDAG